MGIIPVPGSYRGFRALLRTPATAYPALPLAAAGPGGLELEAPSARCQLPRPVFSLNCQCLAGGAGPLGGRGRAH